MKKGLGGLFNFDEVDGVAIDLESDNVTVVDDVSKRPRFLVCGDQQRLDHVRMSDREDVFTGMDAR